MRIKNVLPLACLLTAPMMAQLSPPNAADVTVGHVHLLVKDVEAQTRFWTDMIGGKVVLNGNLAEIQFPGVYLLLTQGDPAGPSEDTVVKPFWVRLQRSA